MIARGTTKRRLGEALVCLAVTGLVAGCSGDEPRHTDGPVGPGPSPGTFEREWRFETDGSDVRMAGGRPVVVLDRGLQAYDVASGEPAWSYREPGRALTGFATTDGMIVVRTRGPDQSNSHVAGLDAETGDLRWEADEDWRLPGTAVGGTVIVEAADRDVRLGIDARTGDERWRVSLDDLPGDGECAAGNHAGEQADGPVIGVHFLCGGLDDPVMVAAVDVGTGEVRWSAQASSPDADHIATARDGSTVLLTRGDSGTPELRDADGRRVFAGGPGTSCSCSLFASGPYVVLHHRERGADDERGMVAIIDSRSGKRRLVAEPAQRSWSAGRWIADGEGHAYGVGPMYGKDGELLLPAAVQVFDMATGTFRRSPLPVQGAPGGRLEPVTVLSAAGNRIVAAFGTHDPKTPVTVASFARTGGGEPYELGGVPVKRWPDACALLEGIPRPDGQSIQDEQAVRIGRWELPRVACRLATPGGSIVDSVGVRVEWVAATERQADLLVDGDPAPLAGVAEVGESAVHPGQRYRIGRAILVIEDHSGIDSAVDRIVDNVRRFLER